MFAERPFEMVLIVLKNCLGKICLGIIPGFINNSREGYFPNQNVWGLLSRFFIFEGGVAADFVASTYIS
jgi:hypothetical protein